MTRSDLLSATFDYAIALALPVILIIAVVRHL